MTSFFPISIPKLTFKICTFNRSSKSEEITGVVVVVVNCILKVKSLQLYCRSSRILHSCWNCSQFDLEHQNCQQSKKIYQFLEHSVVITLSYSQHSVTKHFVLSLPLLNYINKSHCFSKEIIIYLLIISSELLIVNHDKTWYNIIYPCSFICYGLWCFTFLMLEIVVSSSSGLQLLHSLHLNFCSGGLTEPPPHSQHRTLLCCRDKENIFFVSRNIQKSVER